MKPQALILDHVGTHGQLANVLDQSGYIRTVSASSQDLVDRACINSAKIVGPLNSLEIEDQSFDAVVSVRFLAHSDDLAASIREMCRLARTSVIVDYPSRRSLNLLSRWLFKYKKRIERNTREFATIPDNQLRKMFEDNGFRLVSVKRQFFIPMALHRAARDGTLLRAFERVARAVGLTKLIGNPVLVRFDRVNWD